MAVRAVIDTNIWVSSLLNPYGFPAKLRKSFEKGVFNVIISAPMLEELAEVLASPRIQSKYEIYGDDIKGLLELLEQRAEDVLVSGNVEICRDKDDNVVIETAVKGHSEYLVTRDDDIKFDNEVVAFLSQRGVIVIFIAKFLEILSKN